MLFFALPLLLSLSTEAKKIHVRSFSQHLDSSAASDAQIRFAIENKYDDTGPGAKEPEYAYKTFTNLDDALVSYLDDPDTKLPEHERAKAYERLFEKPISENDDRFSKPEVQRYLPKTVEEYFGPQKNAGYSVPNVNLFYDTDPKLDFGVTEGNRVESLNDLNPEKSFSQKYKLKPLSKFQPVKSQPLGLTHYTREQDDEPIGQVNRNPQYTFSYGVHDKKTGDSKSAHETRDGAVVRGYYTFMDADGKQRTVHYTADDKRGFRATVQRTPTNTQ